MDLEIKNMIVQFGPSVALRGISQLVKEGQSVGIIGANGAGKTTLLRTISGLNHPAKGEIWFNNKRIDKLAPDAIRALGIVHVPEGRGIFPYMKTEENLLMGCYLLKKRNVSAMLEHLYYQFPILKERKRQQARSLSGGEQQILAIARGLVGEPKVMMLDEPSLGLAPLMTKQIMKIISTINRNGVSVILSEQNARAALKVVERSIVIEKGEIVLDGETKTLENNDYVKKTYLGE